MATIELLTLADPERTTATANALAAEYTVTDVSTMDRHRTTDLLRREFPDLVDVLDITLTALRRDGLAFIAGVPTRSDLLLALMCGYLGELVPATDRPRRYLEHITPSDAVSPDQRPHSQRRSALMPHTDQSARGNPPDYLALACVANEAEVGGESVLVPIEPIAEHLVHAHPDVYDLLQDPVFPIFNVPKRDFAVTESLLRVRERIADDGTRSGYHQLRFRDEAIRAGMEVMNRPGDQHVAAFERLSTEIHDERWWLIRRLSPGDMVVFDNKRILHGRTAILGDHHRDLKRLNGRYWPDLIPAGHRPPVG